MHGGHFDLRTMTICTYFNPPSLIEKFMNHNVSTQIYPAFANSVDLDQLTSELVLHCLSISMRICIYKSDQVIWAWRLNLFNTTRVNIKFL